MIYKPRWIADKIRKAIEFSSIVVISGARQTGKSTLLKNESPFKDWHYVTFDDIDLLSIAQRNPFEILNISEQIIIDEAQKCPSFINAVKVAVDNNKDKKIILSGSSNLLLIKNISESLAGRAIYLDLMPFAYSELYKQKNNDWFFDFIKTGIIQNLDLSNRIKDDLGFNLFRGFLPPVTSLKNEEQIIMWLKSYIKTYLERDLRDISQISNLSDFKRLMEIIAIRNSCILKQSEVARDSMLSQATAGRYINILEATNLFLKVKPYLKNISQRIIKSPKIFVVDTGLATTLAGFTSVNTISQKFKGALLESFVLINLIVRANVFGGDVFYFRTQGGKEKEVDFVFESQNNVVAIEVKLSGLVSMKDIQNLLFFKDITQKNFRGLIVYSGKEIKQLTKNIFAVPWYSF